MKRFEEKMGTVLERTRDLAYGLRWQRQQAKKEFCEAERDIAETEHDIVKYDALIDVLPTCIPEGKEDFYVREAWNSSIVAKANGKRDRAYETIDRLDHVVRDSIGKMRKLDIEIAVADARIEALRRVLV